MVNGKTKSGFIYSIDERIVDDWRLVDAIADADSADESAQIRGTRDLVNLILGVDGSAALKEHLSKLNDGFVPAKEVTKEIVEIIQNVKKSKNS